jgi:hypothetical protein
MCKPLQAFWNYTDTIAEAQRHIGTPLFYIYGIMVLIIVYVALRALIKGDR